MRHFGKLYRRYLAETMLAPSYIFMTILYVVMIVVGFNINSIISFFRGPADEPAYRYVMVDATTSESASALKGQTIGSGRDAIVFPDNVDIEDTLDPDIYQAIHTGEKLTLNEEQVNHIKEVLESHELQGIIRLSEGDDQNLGVHVYALDNLDLTQQMTLEGLFQQVNQQRLINTLNLPAEDVQAILTSDVTMQNERIAVTAADERSADEKSAGMWVAYFISFIVFFMNTLYGNSLSAGIATEKSSRVMEVLVTSVSPRAHLLARILASLTSAMIQLAIILGTAFITLQFTDMRDTIFRIIQDIRPMFLVQSLLFLIVTVLFCLVLAALLGSLVNTVQDASQALAPLMLVLVLGFYITLSGLFSADNAVMRITSYIPLVSGMVMPMRIGATSTPLIVGWISLAISVVALVIMYLITAQVYKGAVITYRTGNLGQKLKSAWYLRS